MPEREQSSRLSTIDSFIHEHPRLTTGLLIGLFGVGGTLLSSQMPDLAEKLAQMREHASIRESMFGLCTEMLSNGRRILSCGVPELKESITALQEKNGTFVDSLKYIAGTFLSREQSYSFPSSFDPYTKILINILGGLGYTLLSDIGTLRSGTHKYVDDIDLNFGWSKILKNAPPIVGVCLKVITINSFKLSFATNGMIGMLNKSFDPAYLLLPFFYGANKLSYLFRFPDENKNPALLLALANISDWRAALKTTIEAFALTYPPYFVFKITSLYKSYLDRRKE